MLDDRDHHLTFKDGHPVYLCSNDPRMVREAGDNREKFLDDLADGHSKYERIAPTDESVRSWNERLIAISDKHRWHFHWYGDKTAKVLRNRPPLNTLAYLARTFFDCNVLVVAPRETGGRQLAG